MDKYRLTETRALLDPSVFRKFVVAMAIAPSSVSARDRRDCAKLNEPTANQVIGLADASIARFKADLRLTPDQEKNWGPIQTVLHDMAKRRADRTLKLHDDRAAATQPSEAKDSKVEDGKAGGSRLDS
jgi:hypothetical protein